MTTANTTGEPARIAVQPHMLPMLFKAAVYLISEHARALHQAAQEAECDDCEWDAFDQARDALDAHLMALEDLRQSDPRAPMLERVTLLLIVNEAASIATMTLDDGVEMGQLLKTLDGLDNIATRVRVARQMRELADSVVTS